MRHPEDSCHRCGRPNPAWSAPSPLWNAVMRENGSIDGEELFDGIVCPTCFTLLATVKGVADTWYLVADEVLVPLETVTPSGRVWSDELRLWVDP